MTLRALFALLGAMTFGPAVAFLILFRPPRVGSFWKHMQHAENVGTWWVASSLRLLASAVAMGGFRVMVTNILNGDKPVIYAGWLDKITAIITTSLTATAAVVFFLVYLAFRIWPAEDIEVPE